MARYLQSCGYKIVPVNPNLDEALGERAYARLEDIPEPVDIIDVFRRSEFVRELTSAAASSGAKLFWMQEDVRDAEAAEELRKAGLEVVEDRCLMVEHMRISSR